MQMLLLPPPPLVCQNTETLLPNAGNGYFFKNHHLVVSSLVLQKKGKLGIIDITSHVPDVESKFKTTIMDICHESRVDIAGKENKR